MPIWNVPYTITDETDEYTAFGVFTKCVEAESALQAELTVKNEHPGAEVGEAWEETPFVFSADHNPFDTKWATRVMVGGPYDGCDMTGDESETILHMPTSKPETQEDADSLDQTRSAKYVLDGDVWRFDGFVVEPI